MKPLRSATLKEILHDPDVKKAFDDLVGRGADGQTLGWFLRSVASPSLPESTRRRSDRPPRRQLKALSSTLLKTAKSIESHLLQEHGLDSPAEKDQSVCPLPLELMAFVTFKAAMEPSSPLCHLIRLPALLRECARIVDFLGEKPKRTQNLPSLRNELVVNLLVFVKEKTGRACYNQVATLLNAADSLRPGKRTVLWDSTYLGVMASREHTRTKRIRTLELKSPSLQTRKT